MNYSKNSLYYICILIAFLIMASIANAQELTSFNEFAKGKHYEVVNEAYTLVPNQLSDTLSNVKRLSDQNERLSRELYNLRKELYISDFMKQRYTELYWTVVDMLKYMLDDPIGKSSKYTISFKKYQLLLSQLK